MVDKIKKQYIKRNGIEEKDNLPTIVEAINRLFRTERAAIDEGIKAAKAEYDEKMFVLNKEKEKNYKHYVSLAKKIVNLSRFKVEKIGPILAEIITLFELNEFDYQQVICTLGNHGPRTYAYAIVPRNSVIETINLYSLEMLLVEGNGDYQPIIPLFNIPVKIIDRHFELKQHQIFERCPYLLEYVEMLIENEVAKLPEEEQLPAMKKIEAEFIHKNLEEIKKHYEEINLQEQIDYQNKLAENKENRENILAKTLEKINTKSKLQK